MKSDGKKKFKTGVKYSTETYTIKEMTYLLFQRKKCPICKTQLIKQKKKIYNGYGETTMRSFSTPLSHKLKFKAERYTIVRHYYCDNCNKEYSVSELAGE